MPYPTNTLTALYSDASSNQGALAHKWNLGTVSSGWTITGIDIDGEVAVGPVALGTAVANITYLMSGISIAAHPGGGTNNPTTTPDDNEWISWKTFVPDGGAQMIDQATGNVTRWRTVHIHHRWRGQYGFQSVQGWDLWHIINDWGSNPTPAWWFNATSRIYFA